MGLFIVYTLAFWPLYLWYFVSKVRKTQDIYLPELVGMTVVALYPVLREIVAIFMLVSTTNIVFKRK